VIGETDRLRFAGKIEKPDLRPPPRSREARSNKSRNAPGLQQLGKKRARPPDKRIAHAWDAADSDRSGRSNQSEVFTLPIDCLLSRCGGAHLIPGSASSPVQSVLNEIIRR